MVPETWSSEPALKRDDLGRDQSKGASGGDSAPAARQGEAAEGLAFSDALLAELGLDEPAGKSFFALALRFETLFRDAPPFGSTVSPTREIVRFRANPTFGFPAEEVASVAVRQTGASSGLDVMVNFLGLYGPSSPLPPLYTERAIAAEGEDRVLTTFLDFFHHRLVSLIVQIWKHHRYYLRYQSGGQDRLSACIAALFGMLPRHLDEHARDLRVTLLPYAGLLSLYSRSAAIISHIISEATGHPTHIEEFISRLIRIPEPQRARLGVAQTTLGEDFVLGEEMADDFGKFRVSIGPLTRAAFERLQPGEPDFTATGELIRLSIKDPLMFEHALELAPGEAPAWQLGKARLGWTTWLDPFVDRALSVVLQSETI